MMFIVINYDVMRYFNYRLVMIKELSRIKCKHFSKSIDSCPTVNELPTLYSDNLRANQPFSLRLINTPGSKLYFHWGLFKSIFKGIFGIIQKQF